MPFDAVLQFLGQVVAYGGVGALVALALFRYLGKQWLDEKFAQRLDAFRHEQAKELQRMRVEVESVLSGALKMQEREFSVLPVAWERMVGAYSHTEWVVSPLQSFVDVISLEDDELEEFLSQSGLTGSEQRRIRDLRTEAVPRRDAQAEASEIIFRRRVVRAKAAVGELEKYRHSNGLFFFPGLKDQCVELERLLWRALALIEAFRETGPPSPESAQARNDLGVARGVLGAIESAIEQRLHSHRRPG